MAPIGPEPPGANLPAPYRSPWSLLAGDLVAVGADLALRDNNGTSALDFAEMRVAEDDEEPDVMTEVGGFQAGGDEFDAALKAGADEGGAPVAEHEVDES